MWQELRKSHKIIITLLFCALIPLMPELIFMADLGGIEFIFTFFVLYYKPQLLWLKTKCLSIKAQVELAAVALKESTFCQPKIFATQGVFYCCAIIITGSVLFSSLFLLPALLINPHLS